MSRLMQMNIIGEGDQYFLYNVISTIKEMSEKMSLILQQYNKNASCTTIHFVCKQK